MQQRGEAQLDGGRRGGGIIHYVGWGGVIQKTVDNGGAGTR